MLNIIYCILYHSQYSQAKPLQDRSGKKIIKFKTDYFKRSAASDYKSISTFDSDLKEA